MFLGGEGVILTHFKRKLAGHFYINFIKLILFHLLFSPLLISVISKNLIFFTHTGNIFCHRSNLVENIF
jgi:hypothetical protein